MKVSWRPSALVSVALALMIGLSAALAVVTHRSSWRKVNTHLDSHGNVFDLH